MGRPAFVPTVVYDKPLAAMRWLEAVFGFETTMLVTDAAGELAHAEMGFEGGAIAVSGPWAGPPFGPARSCSPASVDGAMTQFLRVNLAAGLDAHCERARAAGATIVAEPAEQFYGARVYRAVDPEGHLWSFSQETQAVSIADMEAATGLRIHASLGEAGHG